MANFKSVVVCKACEREGGSGTLYPAYEAVCPRCKSPNTSLVNDLRELRRKPIDYSAHEEKVLRRGPLVLIGENRTKLEVMQTGEYCITTKRAIRNSTTEISLDKDTVVSIENRVWEVFETTRLGHWTTLEGGWLG